MAEKRIRRSRRDALLVGIGGQPAPYAALSVVMAAWWFPFRLLLLDKGDPIAEIIVASGLSGTLWALIWPALDWGQRVYPRTGRPFNGLPHLTDAERRARARRGAIVGSGIGVPFFGGLIILCLGTGRSWGYVTIFTIALIVIAAVAARTLRHHSHT